MSLYCELFIAYSRLLLNMVGIGLTYVISTGIGVPRPLAVLVDLRSRFGRRVQLLQVYRSGSTRSVFICNLH